MRLLIQRMLAAMAFAGALTPPTASAEKLGAWDIEETVTPLTGATSIAAVLASTQPLINSVGAAAPAGLVLRCRDGQLVAYVSWVQVLSTISALFTSQTQTLVLWRTDQRAISANYWQVDNAFIAAGMFGTKPAVKFIEKLTGAKQLVVRMSSSTSTQDAVFDLGDVTTVAERVSKPCGVTWTRHP
ncbi:MAG: hypothetical protein PGN23_06765 [Sphingomonas adhaesiva]|uniref:hypothetical protein n=1 Tax=Sphingomonas adhaesiva TaxID=28212 RepID=UPI002FFB4E3C